MTRRGKRAHPVKEARHTERVYAAEQDALRGVFDSRPARAAMTSRDFFDACYTILVRECAAREGDRTRFIDAVTAHDRTCTEWRFMGSLGFGGKFYVDYNRVRVGCYSEDDTPERTVAIDRVGAEMGR